MLTTFGFNLTRIKPKSINSCELIVLGHQVAFNSCLLLTLLLNLTLVLGAYNLNLGVLGPS